MSQYFKARRKRGACYGTLWKQHSSNSTPPDLYSFKDEAELKAEAVAKANKSSMNIGALSASGSGPFRMNGNKKEAKIRNDYLTMTNGGSSSGKKISVTVTSSSTSSKKNIAGVETLTAALEKNERAKCYEFCVLIGNTLTCYENLTAFRRGDHPSSEVRIVGASAWNPPPTNRTKRSMISRASSPISPDSPTSSGTPPSFRLLTNAGTHVYCSAQTGSDRDIWLAALHSGLEITYAGFNDTLTTLSSLSNSVIERKLEEGNEATINTAATSKSTSTLTSLSTSISLSIDSSSKILEPTILTPPIPKRSKTNISNFVKRITTSSSPGKNSLSTETNHNAPFLNPYETSNAPLSKTHCISCGKYPPEDIVKPYPGTPLSQYGLENVVDNVCQPCLIGQGVLRHVMSITGLYVSDAHERVALVKGLEIMNEVLEKLENEEEMNNNDANCDDEDDEKKDKNNEDTYTMSIKIMNERKAKLDNVIINLLHDVNFSACRHRSRTLDHIASQLTSGEIVTAEFIDKLSEYANDAATTGNISGGSAGGENNGSINDTMHETIQMKKEALMVAGDMRAAIEMLHEHALPKVNTGMRYGIGASATKGGTEMLSCILEFFLDLCEQNELGSVAFFWPQICQIHMQMLPPTDTESLIRIELVEDFLLTVCMKHSVHLALQLVWSCLADLEESIGAGNTPSPSCRRRRFAMLRFVCELESLLFDMDGGWGGGSVCLRGMLCPSEQQAEMMKSAMEVLQLHRRFSSHHLTRSARLDKMRLEAAENTEGRQSNLNMEESIMDAAERKYQIARNAEYFSTQLMFCRRLGDIAERLRFMDVDERKDALKEDLEMFNASGRLGGDPLNNICDASTGLVNVMHIPCNEGHVFRSKERTPVLLLMEIISDQKIFESTPNSPKKILFNEKDDQNPETKEENITISEFNLSVSKIEEEIVSSECSVEEKKTAIDEHKKEAQGKVDLLGLNEDTSVVQNSFYQHPPSPKVLQSPKSLVDGETETKEVGNMVKTMVHEQLKLVTFPDLSATGSNDSFLSCRSESNPSEDDKGTNTMIVEERNNDETEDHVALENDETNMESNDGIMMDIQSEEDETNAGRTGEDLQEILLPDASEETAGDVLIEEFIPRDEMNCVEKEDGAISKIQDSDTKEEVALEQQETIEDNKNELIDLELVDDPIKDDDNERNNIDATPEALIKVSPKQRNSTIDEKAGEFIDFPGSSSHDDSNASFTTSKEKISTSHDINDKSSSIVRKVSAFGSFKDIGCDQQDQSSGIMASLNFAANGEGRRHVLNTIFVKGMRSSNLIARGVAPAARRAVQTMDRKRAQLLMNATNRGKNDDTTATAIKECETSLNSLDISVMDQSDQNNIMAKPSEEDECVEAIRLLLVQNRVALGKLSPENAALALKNKHLDSKRHGNSDDEVGDAGNIDSRLAGCGPTSSAILSAIKLWKDGMVSNGELLELIQKDLQFTQVTLPGTKNETILIEDSAFWGRFAFGERWAEKKSRIQSSSTFGAQPGWDLTGVIVKSNDDLRQEAFAMQLIELSKEAFEIAGLELWIQPYRILATGRTTGIIEMVRNAMSFDSLKKRPGYSEGGLLGHFKRMAEHAADPNEALMTAKRNFIRSLAAYSLLSYFFEFKDRHNGNLLLDTAGHVIHIDFGFIFGIAPGGSFSLESSVPFKLTDEMIEVMDGLGSVLFSEFVTLFCCGFLALQAHTETFVTIVQITCEGSTFNCFEGKDIREIIFKLRERFCPKLNKEATIAHAMELIRLSTNSLGTKQYDFFQYLSQGIAA